MDPSLVAFEIDPMEAEITLIPTGLYADGARGQSFQETSVHVHMPTDPALPTASIITAEKSKSHYTYDS